MPRLAMLALKLYESTGTALTAPDATCATAAAAFRALKVANTDYLAAREAVLSSSRTRALQDAIDARETHGQPFATASALILNAPLMNACATDRSFIEGYEDLFGATR